MVNIPQRSLTSEVKSRMDDPERCIQFEVQLKALLAKLGGEGKAQLEEEMKYISQKKKRGSGSGDSGDDGPGRERRSRSRGRKNRLKAKTESTKQELSKQDLKKRKFVLTTTDCSQLAIILECKCYLSIVADTIVWPKIC